MHEEGATVPYKGKLLSIPMAAAKTAAGVPRWKSPLDVPESDDAFWITTHRGRHFFVRADENDNLTFLFVGLDRNVTIPARRPLGKANESSRAEIVAIHKREIGRATRA